jgi:hypothetical protein
MNKKEAIIFISILLLVLITYLIMFGNISLNGLFVSHVQVGVDEGIHVLYSTFSGNTTDFIYLNDSQLEIITNMTLEKPLYGKIEFLEEINLTEDVHNNIVDLDNNVFIFNNLIKINTTELASLNKPAKISLYNVPYNDIQILRDGEVCPSSICQELSYSGGTLIFTITDFSSMAEYSAGEIPSVPEPILPGGSTGSSTGSSSGSSSGGGRLMISKGDFYLDKSMIKVIITQGESKRETFTIENTGTRDIIIDIMSINLSKFMILSPVSFLLKEKESREINLDIYAKDDEIADSYFGYIIVKGAKMEKYVNVILDIKSKKPLFDISINIAEKYIFEGQKIKANISLINKGDLKYMDVLLKYSVKTFDGKTIISKEESVAIEKELVLEREFLIPNGTVPGDYILYVKVIYGNESAASSENLKVIERESPASTNDYYKVYPYKMSSIDKILVIILPIIILFIIVLVKKWYFGKPNKRRARHWNK